MRTLILLAALIPFAGCSSSMKRADPLIPETHKMTTPAQRRTAHQMEESRAVAGQTKVEGALAR